MTALIEGARSTRGENARVREGSASNPGAKHPSASTGVGLGTSPPGKRALEVRRGLLSADASGAARTRGAFHGRCHGTVVIAPRDAQTYWGNAGCARMCQRDTCEAIQSRRAQTERERRMERYPNHGQ